MDRVTRDRCSVNTHGRPAVYFLSFVSEEIAKLFIHSSEERGKKINATRAITVQNFPGRLHQNLQDQSPRVIANF